MAVLVVLFTPIGGEDYLYLFIAVVLALLIVLIVGLTIAFIAGWSQATIEAEISNQLSHAQIHTERFNYNIYI